jgi:hypothetical protein
MKVELARLGHERHHRGRSTRDYAHARVQPSRQLRVKVQQVARIPGACVRDHDPRRL